MLSFSCHDYFLTRKKILNYVIALFCYVRYLLRYDLEQTRDWAWIKGTRKKNVWKEDFEEREWKIKICICTILFRFRFKQQKKKRIYHHRLDPVLINSSGTVSGGEVTKSVLFGYARIRQTKKKEKKKEKF